MLKLPAGADAGFRLVDTDEFGNTFTIHLYGSGRKGWFLASQRFPGHDRDSGRQPLGKGQWRTFVNLVKQARFWQLPEQWPPEPPKNETVDGGELLDFAGREAGRYHRIHRFVWREPGLDQVLAFCRQVSGFFARHPISGIQVPDLSSGETTTRAEGRDHQTP